MWIPKVIEPRGTTEGCFVPFPVTSFKAPGFAGQVPKCVMLWLLRLNSDLRGPPESLLDRLSHSPPAHQPVPQLLASCLPPEAAQQIPPKSFGSGESPQDCLTRDGAVQGRRSQALLGWKTWES